MPDAQPLIINDWNASFHLIQTPFGLVIDALNISGARAKIDTDPFHLSLDKAGNWEAFIEQAALQMFLENRIPEGIKELEVRLVPGEIRVSGKARIIVDIPVEAVCVLNIRDGKQIWVEVDSVSVGGSAAKNLVQAQIDKVNPVLDVADLPLNLLFTSVEILDGEVVARGTIEPR